VGVQGNYYVVSVAGNTNLNGITDWNLGDWAIFNGSAWEKVDNTDAVISVNGQVGAVVLTTTDIAEGTNLYYTESRVRNAISLTTTGNSGASTYSNVTGAFNIPNYTLAGLGGVPLTRELTINGVTFDLSANRSWNVGTVTSVATSGPLTGGTITGSGTIGITQSGASSDGFLSSTDWNTFNNKQNAITDPVTGTGTPNTLPMWGSTTSLVNSPLSYAADAFNFGFNSATGGTVNFTNTGLTTYTYSIQMNNFGSPRSTVHSYTDGLVIQSIGGTQVSRMFANGNTILGTGVVDNGYKLELSGTFALRATASASAATQIPVFTSDPSGTTRELVTRTPAQLIVDGGGIAGTLATGQVAFGTAANTIGGDNGLFWNNTNKRLGIGTTSPLTRLDIGVGGFIRSNSSGVNYVDIGYNTSTGPEINTQGFNAFRFKFSGTETFQLTDNGAKLVGNFNLIGVNDLAYLQLYSSSSGVVRLANKSSNANFGRLFLATNSTDRFGIFTNGNVLIQNGGTFVDAGFRLDVNGTARVTSTMRIDTINNGVGDFITTDVNGVLTRRTAAQTLTDIGAQGALTLTTIGSSGPATLISNTLNIPDYGSVLTGYVPYSGATQNVNLGEFGLTTGFLGFDLTPTNTPSTPGTMFWSADDETVDIIMDAAVTQKVGQETFYLVKNQTGTAIPKGTVVRADGTVGASGRILIAPFLANGTFPSKFCIGVTTETIANGADGFVTAFGKIRQINTASYTEGTVLYASPTSAGGFTTTPPQAPNNIVSVAIVVTSSTNNGSIFVRPIFGSSINEDEGVRITSPVLNQGLFYDGSYWVNKTIAAALGYTPANQATTLTINGQTFDLSANRTWSVGTVTSVGLSVPTGFSIGSSPVTTSGTLALTFASGYSLPTNASQTNWDTAYNNRITSLTTTGTSGEATLISHVLNIPQYQAQGNYITSLTGEATASGPGAAAVTLTNSAVTGKVLTGLTVAGSSIASTDSILTAFGKLQGQVNDLIGGLQYQGTWNASTNTPAITSGVGTDGHFYIVSVAGNTTIDGISGWQVGDWIVFHSPAWQKVDNTESVVSVNGFTGAVTLTTSNISEGTNLYFTDLRARQAISLTTTGNSGAATYNNGTGVFNIPQYTLTGLGGVPNTRSITINGTAFDLSADRTYNVGTVTSIATTGPITGGTITGTGTIGITQASSSTNGFLSSTDWNTFNNKQATISLTTTGNSGVSTFESNVLNVPNYTLSGLGGVPTTRTLSINGVSFDLSANRSWSVGTLTGSGTVSYVPRWDGSTSLTNSLLFDNGSAVGLNTASVNASALFQMDSTTRGFLPPRMTSAQRLAITSPAQGLIVYQTDSVIGLYIYANSTWRTLGMI
jgi:hypothetical protein